MPGMDGTEMARRIRELDGGTKVKIAAISASADTTERARVLAANMDDFLRKPYRASEVFECLAQHLGVKYIVNEHAPALPFEPPSTMLRPEDFSVLPSELRAELAHAVMSLDVVRIKAVIARCCRVRFRAGGEIVLSRGAVGLRPNLLRTQRRTETIGLLRTNCMIVLSPTCPGTNWVSECGFTPIVGRGSDPTLDGKQLRSGYEG